MENKDVCNTVAALQNGCDKAFARIYEMFYGPLYYFVQRIVDNTAEAQEITADSFLQVWKHRSRFESLPNIRAFLYVTARNASFNALKQKKDTIARNRHLNYFLSQDIEGPYPQDEIKAELLQQVLKEIEQLPAQCRKIFRLHFIDGMRNAEIAEKMGLTLQTVKNQKTRAIKLLKLTFNNIELELFTVTCFIISIALRLTTIS